MIVNIILGILFIIFYQPVSRYFENQRIKKIHRDNDKFVDKTRDYYVKNRLRYTNYEADLSPKQKKHNEAMDRLDKEEKENRERQFREAEQAYLKELQMKFGVEMALKIKKNELCVGMTKEMVIEMKMEPLHIKRSVSRGKVREEWFYDGYMNRLGNYSYRIRIVIVEGLVQGWKDLQ